MSKLVSCILPIYNVQDYLEKCINSVINQTYKNIEIILVDDGATDNCGAICDRYISIDTRIKVVHKVNGGLSDARNAGIPVAKGDYFVFIDSDDYIHPQMIELLVEQVEKGADIAVCKFKNVMVDDKVSCEHISSPRVKLLEKNAEKLDYYFEKNYPEFTVAWNKIYPSDYFSNVKYPKGKIHEDEFTTYKLLEKAKKVAFIEEPLYYYVQRGDSIMGEPFNEKRLFRLDAYEERLEKYLYEDRMDWFEKILFLYKLFIMRYANEIKKHEEMSINVLKKYKKNYNRFVFKSIGKIKVDKRRKVSYLAYALYPGIDK